MFNSKVKDFLGKPAPAGYIAGLGRGASGFVTRPDLGPARDNLVVEEPEEEPFDEDEAGLLGRKAVTSGFYDPEDDEADRIYAEIDEKMGERRKSRREANVEGALKRQEALRPKTQLLFADLKRDLTRVSEAEWAALPEVGDFRIKRLKKSGAIENPKERFLPVPDNIHSSLINNQTRIIQDDDDDASTELTNENEQDFAKIGEARGKLLGMHLDQLSQGFSKAPVPNTLEDSVSAVASDEKLAEIGDLKRARTLFASIIKTNKKNPSGWISAARLEYQAGNQKQARALILKGCEECAKSEEIWLETVKMHEGTAVAREFLAKALKNLPESVNLWLMACDKESDPSAKRKILRAALERNSSNAKLWMSLVELEESEGDARLLLTRAVECSPDSVDLWLALARLQDCPTDARKILNRARLACPKNFSIWINAARLEEANDASIADIRKLLSRGATELSSQGVELNLEDWLREAEECENGGDIGCTSELLSIGVDLSYAIDSDGTVNKILNYVKTSNLSKFICIKSSLKAILSKRPNCKEAVYLLIKNLKSFDEVRDELREIFEAATENIPNDPELWISYAREFLNESSNILSRASASLTDESDQIKIWKEAINLEMPNFIKNHQSFEDFISKLPSNADLMIEIVRVFKVLKLKSRAHQVAQECTEKFPKVAEFWISLAENCSTEESISVLKRGLEQDPTSVKLALKISEISDDPICVQLTLEKTRLAIQKCGNSVQIHGHDQLLAALCLWHCPVSVNSSVLPGKLSPNPIIRAISDNASLQAVKLILNQSLKELPRSALLWHLAIALEPRHLRRSKAIEALRRFENNNENRNKREEAILRWILAMLLDGPARESELSKALELDPLNFDLKAYTSHLEGEYDWRNTNGVNWLRLIEREQLYFEPTSVCYERFIEFLNDKMES